MTCSSVSFYRSGPGLSEMPHTSCEAEAEAAAAEEWDVAVVGFGPVGKACARLLALQGHRVVVLERHDGDLRYCTNARAINFDAETLRVLQGMGDLDAAFEPTIEYIPGKQIVSGSYLYGGTCEVLNGEGVGKPDGSPSTGGWQGKDAQAKMSETSGFRMGGRFFQPALEKVLLEALELMDNVKILYGSDVCDIDEGDDGVSITVRTGTGGWSQTAGHEWVHTPPAESVERVLRCRYAIGADGSKSALRRKMTKLRSFEFDEPWLVVDIMLHSDELVGTRLPYYLQQVADPKRPLTVVPGSRVWNRPECGRHFRFELSMLPGEGNELVQPDNVKRLLAPWLQAESYTVVRAATYHFHALVAEQWQSSPPAAKGHGRLFVAGDAAHVMPPFRGMGMGQGYEDAYNLCWKLSLQLRKRGKSSGGANGADAAAARLLQTYGTERRPVAETVIHLSMDVGKTVDTFVRAQLDGTLTQCIEAAKSAGYGAPPPTSIALEGACMSPSLMPSGWAGRMLPQPPRSVSTTDTRGKKHEGRLDDLIAACSLVRERAAVAMDGAVYIEEHNVATIIKTALSQVLKEKPADPLAALGGLLAAAAPAHNPIAYRFALVCRAGVSVSALWEGLTPASRALLTRLDFAVVAIDDPEGGLGGLLHTCDVAAVRPDKVLFGATVVSRVDEMLAELEVWLA